MCGRFEINEQAFLQAETIARVPDWIQGELRFGDIYPSMKALVLRHPADDPQQNQLEGDLLTFGHTWLRQQKKQQVINARSETVMDKWMFSRAFKNHRAVVVCSRFYEWDGTRQKISFFEPGQTMYLAAVILEDSFVILTREADASVAPFHHRMPVIFDARQARRFVCEADPDRAFFMMKEASPSLEHAGDHRQLGLWE